MRIENLPIDKPILSYIAQGHPFYERKRKDILMPCYGSQAPQSCKKNDIGKRKSETEPKLRNKGNCARAVRSHGAVDGWMDQ